MQIAGLPSLVMCGDRGLEQISSCVGINVCCINDSTHWQRLSGEVPGTQLVPVSNNAELLESFVNGTCNVIAHEGYNLGESLVRELGYEGQYMVGATLFTKEPLAMASNKDDVRFADFVNGVLQALVVAEAYNITQSTADALPETTIFGEQYRNMFRDAVAAVGNYGELYSRYMEIHSPREGLNLLNDGARNNTGLMYAHPLGDGLESGPVGETLRAISERKSLRCGVRSNRPGFAMLEFGNESTLISASGMEIDYCRALAGGILDGKVEKIDFVEVMDEHEGFSLLAAGDLDVFASATWNFENDISVPNVGEGFSFSQPFFYGVGADFNAEENLSLATRQSDHQWSSLVYWIAAAVVQAEEDGITQGMSNLMPDIFLFGSNFPLIFQDAILAVGNYGEIYSRNLETIIPRAGRNMLGKTTTPQLHPLPGIAY